MKQNRYSSAFYTSYADDSYNSANEILRIVEEIVHPKSVVDVGCGIGTWLKVWQELGVERTLGIDGNYVRTTDLLIPGDRFKAMDLSAPTELDTRFDLVQSLEVGEHLPDRSAAQFVSFLCSLGPVVLFSAAIPYQGGTHHVNEQWPEYWAELFMREGYVPVDAIRDRVWDNPRVAYYYAQNALLFVEAERVGAFRDFCRGSESATGRALSRVHPRKWLSMHEAPMPIERLIRKVPRSICEFGLKTARKIRKKFAWR